MALNTPSEDQALVTAIARAIAGLGGRAYFVGGYVRDALMGWPMKDVDIEVYGISPERLRAVLAGFGTVTERGAAFGVLGLSHSGLDIAMPRRESVFGAGHRDFNISVDPWLAPHEAARRRDFTVNAMLRDVLTGEILDYWNGRGDLEQKVLRHVDDKAFVEDPLRVFRAAQFSARLGFTIAPDTARLCAGMEVSALSRERVFEEMAKALRGASTPSVFFRALRGMGHLSGFFPELLALSDVPQHPVYHPEGDVFEHTMLTLDAAAALRERAEHPFFFMIAALCHDLGKLNATVRDHDTGKITAYEHPETGVPLTLAFLTRLTAQKDLLDYAVNMVRLHMRPNMLAKDRSKPAKTRALFDVSVCPSDLILLARADIEGKLDTTISPERERFLRQRLEDYRAIMQKPMVRGQDLLEAGFPAGPKFRMWLDRAKKLHFAGMEKDQVLALLRKENLL